jgi:hypothetical protein
MTYYDQSRRFASSDGCETATAYAGLPDLVLVVNSAGEILEVSYHHASVVCPRVEDLLGTSFFHYVHENSLLGLFRVVVDLVLGDVPMAAVHLHMQLQQGHRQEFEGTATAVELLDPAGFRESESSITTRIEYSLQLVSFRHSQDKIFM